MANTKTKTVCWHCGKRPVRLFNRLGQGVCMHCHLKARENKGK